MVIKFAEEYLRELYIFGKCSSKKHRFQPEIVGKYVKTINILESVNSTKDLYRYNSANYEILHGNKQDLESVRVNDKYRIIFKFNKVISETEITICDILELSNHYK